MTLLDAKEPDQEQERRRRGRLTIMLVVLGVLLTLGPLGFVLGHGWWFWYWPDERIVSHFFDALQKQDYKTAYAIWQHDPEWQRHPDHKAIHDYPFNEFYQDWGPGGQWGVIKTAKIYGASKCPPMGADTSSGIVVDVLVNDRVEHAQVWVQRSDRTLSYPPCQLVFH